FKQGDDPIDAINHMMSFLSAVVTSRYPTTNNQLRNSSNLKKQATINDGRITLQPVQGRQISFATDLGITEGQAIQTVITHNAAYQANDLDVYNSDCNELNTAKVALMENLSHYGSDVLAEIDMEPLAPRLLNNRTAHSDYLRLTQEQAAILGEVVEQGKSQNPLNNFLDSALPPRKPTVLKTDTSKPVLVYAKNLRKSKTNVPVSKPKIIKSISANIKELNFDELTTMASEHSSLELVLHEMTPVTISLGLIPNPPPSTLFVPPIITYYDILFQPMFDELVNPPPSVDPLTPKVITSIAEVVAPKPIASTVISNDVEVNHDLDVGCMNNDTFFGILIPKNVSDASSSLDVIPTVVHTAAPNSEHELISHPDKVMVITLKWIYKVKLDELGGILKNKARLLAHGDREEEGINYEESFALVARLDAIRIFLAFAAHMNMIVYEMDALYGLKQVLRGWYGLFSKFLLSQEFSKGTMDLTLFIRRQGKDIFLSKYALESLKNYGMESSDPVDTSMVEKSKLDEDPHEKVVDPTYYHGTAGTLMYLIASRPDLTFAICMCTQYQAKPTEKHLHAVKRIFKYLRGTVNQGI
nr:retrovirus-related Pol polyprotein from transposon TNT 1-94 [Tanacetum cinerariifolium]